ELEKAGIDFTWVVVSQRDPFVRALNDFAPDVVLCDHSLPNFNSVEAFQLYMAYQKEAGVLIPFILVTGNVSEEFAVQSIKAGIDDYILKDRLKRLTLAIESALEKRRIENERQRYLQKIITREAFMREAERMADFGSWEAHLRTG